MSKKLKYLVRDFMLTLCVPSSHIVIFLGTSSVVAFLDLIVISTFASILRPSDATFAGIDLDHEALGYLLGGAAFCSLLLSSLSTWMLHNLAQKNGALLQQKLFEKELITSTSDIRRLDAAKLLTIVSHDAVKYTNSVFTPLLSIIRSIIQGTIIASGLILNNISTMVIFAAIAGVYVVTYRASRSALQSHSKTIRENSEQTNHFLEASSRGIAEITSNQLNSLVGGKLKQCLDRIAKSQTTSSVLILLPKIVIENFIFIGIAILYVLNEPAATIDLVIYTGASLLKLLPIMQTLYTAGSTINNSYSQIANIKKVLLKTQKQKSTNNFVISIETNDLIIQQNTLNSLPKKTIIKKGTPCILIGKSGVGKTTILNILAGLNLDRAGIPSQITSNISFVSQNPWILPGTLVENIFGRSSVSMTDRTKMVQILTRLYPEELLKDLMKSNDITSHRLSGGEKQKLAIIRAVLSDKDILMFDEPTSALDTTSMIEISDIFDEYCKQKFCIIISHSDYIITRFSQNVLKVQKDSK